MDYQNEYMAMVNRMIFGFETVEEYKELIDLLIQLRTPKLSKDFKPTIINEILSNSLAPLSEDDLRPMSEAIENMDNLKTNLDSLKESYQADGEIARVYEKYNQIVLYEKANAYKEAWDLERGLEKRIQVLEQEILKSEQVHQQYEQNISSLEEEERVLKEEQDSLNASDAGSLKEKEELTKASIEDYQKKITQKKQAIETKNEKRRDIEQEQKEKKQQSEMLFDDIEDHFDEMKICIETVSFDDFFFMADEIWTNKDEIYDFQTHKKL